MLVHIGSPKSSAAYAHIPYRAHYGDGRGFRLADMRHRLARARPFVGVLCVRRLPYLKQTRSDQIEYLHIRLCCQHPAPLHNAY